MKAKGSNFHPARDNMKISTINGVTTGEVVLVNLVTTWTRPKGVIFI